MFRILPPLPLCSMCRPASCERRNTAVRFTAISSSQNSVGYSDRKSTRLNSSHSQISYAVFCLKKKNDHCRTRIILKHQRLIGETNSDHRVAADRLDDLTAHTTLLELIPGALHHPRLPTSVPHA